MPQSEQVPVQCRLTNVSADVEARFADFDFCAFEFPRCVGCSNVYGSVNATIGDPLKSGGLSGWLHAHLQPPT
jgi:hypothetical protein